MPTRDETTLAAELSKRSQKELLVSLSINLNRQQQQIVAMLEQNIGLLRDVKTLLEKSTTLTPAVADELLLGLPEQQRRVFEQIKQVRAMREIESLLRTLEGTDVTKAFTTVLQRLLKDRKLSILCCGRPASPVWQPNKRYAQDGRLEFLHTDEAGRRVKHKGATRFPKVTLTKRPSRQQRTSSAPSKAR